MRVRNKDTLMVWKSSTLATSCEELTHWKRLWCWEGLGAGEEGDDRGWDGWMASRIRCTWVWVNSGRWWWTGRPGVLLFMGSQRVGHDWATELNLLFEYICFCYYISTCRAPSSPLYFLSFNHLSFIYYYYCKVKIMIIITFVFSLRTFASYCHSLLGLL